METLADAPKETRNTASSDVPGPCHVADTDVVVATISARKFCAVTFVHVVAVLKVHPVGHEVGKRLFALPPVTNISPTVTVFTTVLLAFVQASVCVAGCPVVFTPVYSVICVSQLMLAEALKTKFCAPVLTFCTTNS